ncbi:MAG: biopolymer transporter ExbD [Paraburkholderia sp.]|nr:biopolymer transporter ExbD [Paraburkholderia sp.]
MSFSSADRGDEPLAEINVTPLVDVLLVLLVIFLVMAPLLTHALHIDLPKVGAAGAEARDHTVSVSLDARGRIYLEGNETSLVKLGPALRHLAAQDPRITVSLRSDQHNAFGDVAKALGTIGRAGVGRVAVVTADGDGAGNQATAKP